MCPACAGPSNRTATIGFALGPVGRILGKLALVLGRRDDALRHFEQARAVALRSGSQPWLDQADADVAALASVN